MSQVQLPVVSENRNFTNKEFATVSESPFALAPDPNCSTTYFMIASRERTVVRATTTMMKMP